jgi:HSP20 family molecular chaperone IbpA
VLPLITTLSLQANEPLNDSFFSDPFGDDIFKEMMQMQQDMDKMFSRMQHRMQQRSSGLISPLGTYKITQNTQFTDLGDRYKLITSIPENKENKIDISIKDGQLSIQAKIIEKHENKSTHGYSNSSSMRMYQQNMSIPSDADASSVSAEYKDKKLVIYIKKKKVIAKKKSDTSNITIHTEGNKTKKSINIQKESDMNNSTIHSDTSSTN